jgi:hypothetical protein
MENLREGSSMSSLVEGGQMVVDDESGDIVTVTDITAAMDNGSTLSGAFLACICGNMPDA